MQSISALVELTTAAAAHISHCTFIPFIIIIDSTHATNEKSHAKKERSTIYLRAIFAFDSSLLHFKCQSIMHILLIFSIEILMKEKQKERRIDDVKSHRRLHAVRQAIRCNS